MEMVHDVVTFITFDHGSLENNGLDLLSTQHRTQHGLFLDLPESRGTCILKILTHALL